MSKGNITVIIVSGKNHPCTLKLVSGSMLGNRIFTYGLEVSPYTIPVNYK